MLFELGGRRKRFIQVIYVMLALLLGGGLVLFGIGGDAPGGLGSAVGIDPNNPNQSGNEVLDQDIADANAALATDPKDQEALLTLAKSQYLAGQQQLGADEQGFPVITEASTVRFEESVEAWERYLEVTNGKNFKNAEEAGSTGALVMRAYSSSPLSRRTIEGGLETAQIVAEQRPSAVSWLDVALYAYANEDQKLGEQAAKEALSLADDSDVSTIEQQLKQAERQGKLVVKALKEQAPTEEEFQNPLGGLGGTGSGAGGSAIPPSDSGNGG